MRQLIRQLKLNASPAQDGITAEHLICALDSQIIDHLSYMLTLCIQFGVVPENFRRGVLIPIPKKSGCDTTQAKNWRSITVSSTFSKLLELYVIEECSGHEFSDLQFGFVKGRRTEMATALLHDVISYSTTRGSVVYACSLDADELLMQYHTAFYLTKPKVYYPHIVGLSFMNGIVTSLLTLNGEGVTARILMLILAQDKVGCLRLSYLTFSTKS